MIKEVHVYSYRKWNLCDFNDSNFPIISLWYLMCVLICQISYCICQFLAKYQFSSVQLLSHLRLFATPWTTAHQASLSITNSWSPHKPLSTELAMPSSHLILCHPLLLLPLIFPSIRVFSSELALCSRWPKYWSFSFSIIPSKEIQGWSSVWTGWISLQSKGLSRVFSNITVQKHQFFSAQLSL